jgi:CubicO group peptidase (beta-lactamase class C family)
MLGEVVHRITGRTLGQFFAEEVAQPLGLDFWIGLPESEEHRVAPLHPAPPPPPEVAAMLETVLGPDTLAGRALSANGAWDVETAAEVFNSRSMRATEMPAANGVTNARSLSRLYAACIGEVDGVRLLSEAQMERARREQVRGPDACLIVESAFGLGFWLDTAFDPKLGPGSFGHAGAGGSLGFAHPESGVAFGYVMNQMGSGVLGEPRTAALLEAVRACLG